MGSKFRLLYHVILVVKYRKQLLTMYGDFVKERILELSKSYKFSIEEMEVDKDHIHLLILSHPDYSPKFLINLMKQVTTYYLYKEFKEDLRRFFYHKNVFWSKGSFVSSIGDASEETIRNYIKSQG